MSLSFTAAAVLLLIGACSCSVGSHEYFRGSDSDEVPVYNLSEGVTDNPVVFPDVIEGSFAGKWKSNNTGLLHFDFPTGDFILTVDASETSDPNIQALMGIYFFRNGDYTTKRDINGLLRGCYVKSLGRMALLESRYPLSDKVFYELVNRTSEKDSTWWPSNNATYYDDYARLQPSAHSAEECHLNVFVDVDPDSQKANVSMSGFVSSIECASIFKVDVKTSDPRAYIMSALLYAGIAIASSVTQLFGISRQMTKSSTQAAAGKISIYNIGCLTVTDSYLFLFNLSIGVVVGDILFNAFATAAFFGFILFSVFEMRYLFVIWKFRYLNNEGTFDERRRQLGRFYASIYCVILMGPLVIVWAGSLVFGTALVILYSFWAFQVFHYAKEGTHRALDPVFLVTSTISRILPLWYLFAYRSNFLKLKPNPTLFYGLTVWVLIQLAVLVLQEIIGPRWFIPAFLLPPKYNYYRPIPQGRGPTIQDMEAGSGGTEVHDCVICMNPIEDARRTMVTPCSHVFHKDCLSQWMDIKLECPTCRSVLPPP